jgi:YHS domain-containing protein
MIRALIELLLTIAVVLVARAVLTSILRGFARAATQSFPGQGAGAAPAGTPHAEKVGNLQRDPVCGTYVAEGSALRRQAGGHTFYYCSQECMEKHALAAR